MSFGAISGYFGGRIDFWMMRFVDVMYGLLLHFHPHFALGDVRKERDEPLHRTGRIFLG